jgi:hypothetical protein
LLCRGQDDANCHGFKMTGKYLYPDNYCSSVTVHLSRTGDGKLAIRNLAVDVTQLPAAGTVNYLGRAQIREIHSEGEVQEALWEGDPRPFQIPKHVVTTIETDKGSATVTNDYTLHPAPPKKK